MSPGRKNCTIRYFSKPGKDNTEETLQLAKKRAAELGINTILVASTSGDTGLKAVNLFAGYRVIVVSHVHGCVEPDAQEMSLEAIREIERKGGKVLTAAHAFAGVPRAIRMKFGTYQVSEIIAYALRIFGEGMKVTCEIALMAADAGLARTDREVIAIAGTGSGADTAVVLKPVNTHKFFDMRVREIICKPRL